MTRRNSVLHRVVERIELLIAAASGACVVDDVGAVAVEVRIALIDPSEVGKERDQTAVELVDTVPCSVPF